MLHLVFRKFSNKPPHFHCKREDGSSSWQQSTPFFVQHDLAHFAVEKHLGFQHAFYGLLASGMDITDFEEMSKEAVQSLPEEAILTEYIVSLLQTELSDGQELADIQATLADILAPRSLAVPVISKESWAAIRQEFHQLWQQWLALPNGQSLALVF